MPEMRGRVSCIAEEVEGERGEVVWMIRECQSCW